MDIKVKIRNFLAEKKYTFYTVAEKFETTPQNISRIVNGKGKIPLDFIVWLATEFPEIDLQKLIIGKDSLPIVKEEPAVYQKVSNKKQKALSEIGEILDKYL